MIIAAHNEATGIERCLRSVFSDKVPGLVVTVVPNACRDETADRARGIAVPPEAKLLVFETEVAGKTNAFNLAERKLKDLGLDYFPRLFLDGDIELAAGSIRALLAATDAPGPRIASATPVFDTTGCSIVSRLLYVAARFNPYHTEGAPNGSGTYCVNVEGRARWGEFPDVIADDAYVERQFAPTQRETVATASARVRVPRNMRAVRGVAARNRLGMAELDAIGVPAVSVRSSSSTLRVMARRMLPNPGLWPAFVVFIASRLIKRIDSRRVSKLPRQARWQQDQSTR